jgi:hypothetical protein
MTGLVYPPLYGFATTPRWATAALLGIALFFAPRVRMTAAHWIGLALLAWMFATLYWSEGRFDGTDAAFRLTVVAVAFTIGSTIEDLKPLIIGSVIGIGLSSAVALLQISGFNVAAQYDGCCAGLFYNRNMLAATAAVVAIGLIALPRLWMWLPLTLPALILAPSRAAWLALVAGLLLMDHEALTRAWTKSPSRETYQRARRIMVSARASAVIAAVIVLLTRRIGFDGSARVPLWHDTIDNLTWLGHGLGSFRESFAKHAHFFNIMEQGTRPEHPHNEWLWFAFEGGIPAFALALVLAVVLWHRAGDHPARGILAGLFVLSLMAMPFQDPATAVLGALCAGFLVGLDARVRDETIHRRGLLRPWLANAECVV